MLIMAAWFTRPMVTLQPAKLHHGTFVKIAQQAGVLMLEHTKVRDVSKQGASYKVQYDGGVIDADQVIIATNGYTGW